MSRLSEPSPELAQRLRKEVDYENHLLGVIMNPMAGQVERAIFSFKDACNFLHIDPVEDLISSGGRGSVRYIDFNILQMWIDEVFGDHELASAIKEEAAKEEYYGKQLPLVKNVLQERLSQIEDNRA